MLGNSWFDIYKYDIDLQLKNYYFEIESNYQKIISNFIY